MLMLEGHGGPVRALAYAPDGRFLASASADRTLKLWDLMASEATATLRGHVHFVIDLAFAPDGAQVVSLGQDKMIRFWDVDSGRIVGDLPRQTSRMAALAFSPDGRTLATTSGLITCVAFSPEGTTVAAGASYPMDFNRGTVKLWNITSRKVEALLELTDMGRWTAVYAPGEERVELGGGSRIVKLWQPARPGGDRNLEHRRGLGGVLFSPEGRWLATAAGPVIRLWDTSTGEMTALLRGHMREVQAMAWTPDSRFLLTGGADRSVRVWDAEAGRLHRMYQWPTGKVFALAVAPDGMTAAAAGDSSVIVVWDLDTV